MSCLDDDDISAYAAHALGDAERARVEDHLSTCELCLTLACAAARSDDGDRPGPQRIGRYEVLEMLGEGAMGSVYVAHDPQLDRRVAVKLVRSDRKAHAAMHERLAREAKTMAQVRHPNVVAVYDAGELDDGVFIAMELIDGETLRRWLVRAQRGWREIVRAFVQAGRGLEAAHAAGVVHREFKPDNVLVERGGRVAVGDFGVAAVADSDGADEVIGTPRYMSPEQSRGEPVDPRTDQFSFAVALYEALYGESPAEVPAVPRGSPVPAAVGRVLVRALARDRSARFASIGELLAALERAARPVQRAPLIAAVASVALVGAGVVGWQHHSAPHRAASALRTRLLVGAFDNRTGKPELDGTLDALVGELASTSTQLDTTAGPELDGLAARLGVDPHDLPALATKAAASDPRPVETVHGSVATVDGGYSITMDAAGIATYHGTHTIHALDDTRAAVADLTNDLLAALHAGTLAPADRQVLSTSLPAIAAWVAGQRASIAGNHTAAAEAYRHALALDPDLVEAHAGLGLTLYNLQDKPGATAELEHAMRAADRIPERKRLTLLGDYDGTIGKFSDSVMAYQQLLAKWPGDARTQINLTATAIDANSWPLALEVARAAVRDHASIEIARRNLIIAEVGNDRLDDAARDGQALLAEIPSSSPIAVTTTAIALALLGRRDDAHALVAKLSDPDVAPHAIADLALFEGRVADAEAALAGHSGETDQLFLAWAKLRAGDKAGALAAAKRAMADTSMPLAYLAASAAIDAGDTSGVDGKVRAWSEMAETDQRMYAQLLAGDLARAQGKPVEALAAYRAAGRIGEGWLVHERIARVAAATGDAKAAEQEHAWLAAHRGQGALVANPSLALLISSP
jgi:tRNA A-37 threonylcarbamoyl transferase component Bud32/tetratricopeptide (TPR) repeat protein